MATGRLINTNFWKDIYITNLDPIEKLLFLYLFTNPQTSLAGVYQVSLREVAFDTGIDKDMIAKILERFCEDGKMHYERDWLILRNFIKHQRPNPSIKLGIKKALAELPQWLQNRLNELDFGTQTSLEIPDSPQTGDTLGTSSPQRKLKEAKEKKRNINTTNVVLASPEIFGKPELNELFSYWETAVGYKLSGKQQANRRAASNLLKKHGTEKLHQLIDGVALAGSDKYAPRVSDFCDLQSKFNELILWGQKRRGKGSDVVVIR